MEHQAFIDLTILSAADIKGNWLSADQKVAVAWVDPMAKKTTKAVVGGGCMPQWHERLIVPLNDDDDGLTGGKQLTIEIHNKGVLGDTLRGTVYVPLGELALDGKEGANATLTYQVLQLSGKQHGSLSFVAKIVKPAKSSPMHQAPDRHPSSKPLPESSTFYPPANVVGVGYPCVERVDTGLSSPYQAYPASKMASYPPQPYPPVSYATEQNTPPYQPHPASEMAPYPLQTYPPVSYTAEHNTSPYQAYPASEMASYPPRPYPPVSYATKHNTYWQQPNPRYPAYEMTPHPPQTYPPMNHSYNAPPAPYSPLYPNHLHMPYPPPDPQFSDTLYPPTPRYPVLPHPPHPNYPTYAIPYPWQYPPLH